MKIIARVGLRGVGKIRGAGEKQNYLDAAWSRWSGGLLKTQEAHGQESGLRLPPWLMHLGRNVHMGHEPPQSDGMQQQDANYFWRAS
jgi:hypothetical protein